MQKFCSAPGYRPEVMVHCICTCDTKLCHFVLATLLLTGRSQVVKKFSSQSQSWTSWPPLQCHINLIVSCGLQCFFSFCAAYNQGWLTFLFFSLSKGLDDAQSFLGYILLTKHSFHTLFHIFSLMCTIHHRRDYDE